MAQTLSLHHDPGLDDGMMDVQLTIGEIFRHAIRSFPQREIVSRDGDGIVRYTYDEFGARVAKLAHALRELGIGPGDRVASFGWNSQRHLELYYAVPMIGAVLHTANIRLFPDQVAGVFDHAGDKAVFVDGSLVPALLAAVGDDPTTRAYVVMGTAATPFPGAHDYEALLEGKPELYAWPQIDERKAAMICYTSATTGDPKGVAFTHRSTYVHALATSMPDALNVRAVDCVMPVVPMFHVNAWGLPFVSLMTGAKLVMPGAKLDPQSLLELIDAEGVTMSAGVPTVWFGVRDLLKTRETPATLERLVIGGSAAPPALVDDLERLGIRVIHAWGMTEMSPIGTVNSPLTAFAGDADLARRESYKQGRFTPVVAWRLIDDEGLDVPADGVSRGELWVRGPAVGARYYNNPAATEAAFIDGWFRTGDVCTIDAYGFLEIVDRSKDLVKSGGEWISSVELENALMGHPAVAEAAVFGVPHEKWIERPVAAVVVRAGQSIEEEPLRAWLAERVAKFWLPDRIVFIDAIPRTGVGKFLKRELRERYRDLLA